MTKCWRMIRCFSALFIAGVLCAGCPGGGAVPAKAESAQPVNDGDGEEPSSVFVCMVRMEDVLGVARKCSQFQEVWEKIEKEKQRLQEDLNLLVMAYKRTYAMDMRAAEYLNELEKLEKERGSVLSEKAYKKKLAEMQKILDKDPDLALAVKEQLENSEAYKKRRQSSMEDAEEIERKGKKLQAELQEIAARMAAPVTGRIRDVVGLALGKMLEGECEVICDPSTRKVLAQRTTVKPAGELCKDLSVDDSKSPPPGVEGLMDVTDRVISEVDGVLKE